MVVPADVSGVVTGGVTGVVMTGVVGSVGVADGICLRLCGRVGGADGGRRGCRGRRAARVHTQHGGFDAQRVQLRHHLGKCLLHREFAVLNPLQLRCGLQAVRAEREKLWVEPEGLQNLPRAFLQVGEREGLRAFPGVTVLNGGNDGREQQGLGRELLVGVAQVG